MARTRVQAARRANLRRAQLSRSHDRVVITGLRETARALQLAPKEASDELVRILQLGAEDAAREARRLSPRGKRRKGRRKKPLVQKITTRARPYGALVGAPGVEVGVVNFGKKRLHNGPGHSHRGRHVQRLTPNPFLVEAVENRTPTIQAWAGPAIQNALDRAFDKAGAHG